MTMTTWRELLTQEMKRHGETEADIVAIHPPDLDLDAAFDDGYGLAEGDPFHAWTEVRVYFCVTYDGSEWVGSVPRHPSSEPPRHHGGG